MHYFGRSYNQFNQFGLKVCFTEESIALQCLNVDANISNGIVDVCYTCEYENDSKEELDTEFSFPLNSSASVYSFEVIIGKTHIVAECQEKIQANRTYTDAIDSGHSAFIMQQHSVMDDVFKFKLGNIPPSTKVNLTLKYVDLLSAIKIEKNDPRFKDSNLKKLFVYSLPMILNERYKESNANSEHFEEAINTRIGIPKSFTFNAKLQFDTSIQSITSKNDNFILVHTSDDKKAAKLTLNGEFNFDHDLEMEIGVQEPNALMLAHEAGQAGHGLLSLDCIALNFLPQFESKLDDGYRYEIIFLIDRSGSMQGSRIKNAQKSLLFFLKSLPLKCRFQIIGFGSETVSLFNAPVDYSEENFKIALEHQKSLEADLGGTLMVEAFTRILSIPLTGKGWHRQVILLTDGEVYDQDQVVSLIYNNQLSWRVFAIGLGDGVSTSLVSNIANAACGKSIIVRNEDNLCAAVMDIFSCALQPHATDVSLTFNLKSPDNNFTPQVNLVPNQLPPVYLDTYFTAYGLFKNEDKKAITGSVILEFSIDDTRHSVTAELPNQSLACDSSTLPFHRQAAKIHIKELENLHHKSESKEQQDIKNRIVSTSISANIISGFTSFIGVDPNKTSVSRMQPPPKKGRVVQACGGVLRKQTSFGSRTLQSCRGMPPPPPPHSNFGMSATMFKGNFGMSATMFKAAPMGSCDAMAEDMCDADESCEDMAGDVCDSIPTAASKPAFVETKATISDAGFVDVVAELQSFLGYWVLEDSVATMLKSTVKQLRIDIPTKYALFDQNVWSTGLVLSALRIVAMNCKNEWFLMERKAYAWLVKTLQSETLANDMLLDASKYINTIISP